MSPQVQPRWEDWLFQAWKSPSAGRPAATQMDVEVLQGGCGDPSPVLIGRVGKLWDASFSKCSGFLAWTEAQCTAAAAGAVLVF